MSLTPSASDNFRTHVNGHTRAVFENPFGPQKNPLVQVGSRRWLLQTGLTGIAGVGLPSVLKSEATAAELSATATGGKARSVIQIWLSGGPSQLDMWDMKPEMSTEIRGPFRPISTAIPGVQICEHLPLQAAMMDQFALIRSMDATSSNHTPITFQAANPKAQRTEIGRQGGGYPSMGSVAAKFRGPNQPGMPAYVALANSMVADIYGAGDLGQQFEPLDGVNVNGRFSLPAGVAIP